MTTITRDLIAAVRGVLAQHEIDTARRLLARSGGRDAGADRLASELDAVLARAEHGPPRDMLAERIMGRLREGADRAD